jgi:CheY-like chemotaxis protein
LAAETVGEFDAILLDAMLLRDSRSVELAGQLVQAHPRARVVLLAAADLVNSCTEVAGRAFDGRILKPLKPSSLAQELVSNLADAGPHINGAQGPGTGDTLDAFDIVGTKILVADDNRTNRLVVSKMLNQEKVELHFAETGRKAVELYEKTQPDIVFMDLSMPELSGIEATAKIRELEKSEGRVRTPIIALTANATEADRNRCLEVGMEGYLSKPVKKAELLRTIYSTVTERFRVPDQSAVAASSCARPTSAG